MMRGTPQQPTPALKAIKKRTLSKKKNSEDSGKSGASQNKSKDGDVTKKVKKPAKAKTPAP